MFGRKFGLFEVCVVLIPAITEITEGCLAERRSKECEYKVYVKTDSRKDAGTNDDIYVKIASQGPFLELENYGIDDFQAGSLDTFTIYDECRQSPHTMHLKSSGYFWFLDQCASNSWYVLYFEVARVDGAWSATCPVDGWIACNAVSCYYN